MFHTYFRHLQEAVDLIPATSQPEDMTLPAPNNHRAIEIDHPGGRAAGILLMMTLTAKLPQLRIYCDRSRQAISIDSYLLPLHAPAEAYLHLIANLKWMAKLPVAKHHLVQNGTIPLLWHEKRYRANVQSTPLPTGEEVALSIQASE